MNKLEKLAEKNEAESLAIFEERARHDSTQKDMLGEFKKGDDKCIPVAHKYSAAQLAGSPTTEVLRAELEALRQARDAISYVWNRKRDLLESKLEKYTLPEILSFHNWVLDRSQKLQLRVETVYKRGLPHMDGGRSIQALTNARSVAKIRDMLFKGLKEVQALRLRPLLELHTKINEVVSDYESAILDIPMDDVQLNQSEFSRLRSISADLQQEQKQISYRNGHRYEL